MNVLVTGSTSVIGRHVITHLEGQGCTVRRMSRRPGPSEVYGDLLDAKSLLRAVEGIETILHLAAVTHSDDLELYARVNTTGTTHLLDVARDAGVRRFVFVSSRAVGPNGGAYAVSKWLAERAVRATDLDWVILRPGEVYGTDKHEGIDDLVARARRDRFVVVVSGRRARVSPVFVDDVVAAIERAVLKTEIRRKTYTLAGPEEYTLAQLVRLVGAMPIPVPPMLVRAVLALKRFGLPVPASPDQLERLTMTKEVDFSAAATDLGFAPRAISDALQLRAA